jgi:hypothetical protein
MIRFLRTFRYWWIFYGHRNWLSRLGLVLQGIGEGKWVNDQCEGCKREEKS